MKKQENHEQTFYMKKNEKYTFLGGPSLFTPYIPITKILSSTPPPHGTANDSYSSDSSPVAVQSY